MNSVQSPKRSCEEVVEWRDIPGFKGAYQITPTGRIRSRRGEMRPYEKHYAKTGASTALYVNLYFQGEMLRYRVDALVAVTYPTGGSNNEG